MRHPLLLAGVLLLMPAAAHAQVTIDLRALDALPNAPAPATQRAPRPVLRVVPPGPAPRAALPVPPNPPAGTSAATQTATTTTPKLPPALAAGPPTNPVANLTPPARPVFPSPPPVPHFTRPSITPPAIQPAVPPPEATAPPTATLPTAPPPVASLAPIPPPAAPTTAAPPAPPPVSATAGTTAAPEPAGLRLIFKTDESDLSPASNAAIGELVKTTPKADTITFNVLAYAAGVADDPSIARRLSLARGLSVRAALLADGVPSTRIYIRALGAGTGEGPADRVDMTVMGLSGAAAAAKP